MVRADEPGQDDHLTRIDDLVGALRQRRARPDRFDDAVAREQAAAGDLTTAVIEGCEQGRIANEQGAHGFTIRIPSMTLDELNLCTPEAFVATVGFTFEHSPWIAEEAAKGRPFASIDALHTHMVEVVDRSPEEKRIALISAHPDLAGRVAREGRLTAASRGEQASAGLDKLTPDEIARFERLNSEYRARFGFPFVICAREHGKASILNEIKRRTENDRQTEIATALAEIAKIARLRLVDTIAE